MSTERSGRTRDWLSISNSPRTGEVRISTWKVWRVLKEWTTTAYGSDDGETETRWVEGSRKLAKR